MPFTFECGVCHSSYRLNEDQVTATGVKITCPKCLNFFFLKKAAEALEQPVVEQLAEDGVYQIQMSAPEYSELTSDLLLDARDEKATDNEITNRQDIENRELSTTASSSKPSFAKNPQKRNVLKTVDMVKSSAKDIAKIKTPGLEGVKKISRKNLTKDELSDYPSEESSGIKVEEYLLPISLILILLAGVLFIHYQGVISIPGLEAFRNNKDLANTTESQFLNQGSSQENSQKQPFVPKYGFPMVNESGSFVYSDKDKDKNKDKEKNINTKQKPTRQKK